MNMNKRFRARKILGILLLVIIGVLAFGSIVMVLWNGVMPQIFHLPLITFWQALGLLALCRILFGGFGGRRFSSRHMTPEERERFRQRMRERCGFRPPTPPATAS